MKTVTDDQIMVVTVKPLSKVMYFNYIYDENNKKKPMHCRNNKVTMEWVEVQIYTGKRGYNGKIQIYL